MLVKLTIEYDGTALLRMATAAGPGFDSGKDRSGARADFWRAVRVYGAGRTDAGVHARGQVAAIRLPRQFAPDELERALNGILPHDIVILEVCRRAR